MNRDFRRVLTVVGCGSIGVLLAAIIQVMHAAGFLVDELTSATLTLPEIMAIFVIVFTLIGVILAAMD